MVFSSIAFIMYFMPVFFLVYYILPASYKNAWLFLASLGFYYYGVRGNPGYLLLMIMSVVVNFVAGKLIAAQKTKRAQKAWLVVGVVYDLGWLILFKYLGFLIENLNALFGAMHVKVQLETWNLILPIGISFYTFQIISYLVDVYRRETKAEKSLISLGTYLCMFPQLIAGPIVNYHLIQEQLHKRKHSMEKVESGLKVFALGLAYKVLLANRVGHLWTEVTAIGYESISTPLAWMSIVAYSLQLYFDFYGYSLMAIGLGRMMGFDFPQNFNNPYMAVSMTDFWRRWHISMTGWFRDYVYFSLGGSRCAPWRHYLNIVIVFLCSGLWHGADWRYLAWGLACGLCAAFGAMTAKARKKLEKFNPLYRQAWLKAVCQVTITDLLFCVTLVFFAAALYNADPFAIYSSMLQGWNGLAGSWHQVQQMLLDCGIDGRLPVVLLFGTFVVLAVEHGGRSVTRWETGKNPPNTKKNFGYLMWRKRNCVFL